MGLHITLSKTTITITILLPVHNDSITITITKYPVIVTITPALVNI